MTEKIKSTMPIMDAFGNACMPRNDDSSRFGKLIKLFFDRRCSPRRSVLPLVKCERQPTRGTHLAGYLIEHGVDNWLEVGAGRTLCGLIKRFERKASTSDFESESWRT